MSYDGPTPNEVLKERIQGFGPNGPMQHEPDPAPSTLGDLIWQAVEKMPADLDNIVNQAAVQMDTMATSIDDAFEGFINSLEEDQSQFQQHHQQRQQIEYKHSAENRQELDERAREARRAQALTEKKEVRVLIEKICESGSLDDFCGILQAYNAAIVAPLLLRRMESQLEDTSDWVAALRLLHVLNAVANHPGLQSIVTALRKTAKESIWLLSSLPNCKSVGRELLESMDLDQPSSPSQIAALKQQFASKRDDTAITPPPPRAQQQKKMDLLSFSSPSSTSNSPAQVTTPPQPTTMTGDCGFTFRVGDTVLARWGAGKERYFAQVEVINLSDNCARVKWLRPTCTNADEGNYVFSVGDDTSERIVRAEDIAAPNIIKPSLPAPPDLLPDRTIPADLLGFGEEDEVQEQVVVQAAVPDRRIPLIESPRQVEKSNSVAKAQNETKDVVLDIASLGDLFSKATDL